MDSVNGALTNTKCVSAILWTDGYWLVPENSQENFRIFWNTSRHSVYNSLFEALKHA